VDKFGQDVQYLGFVASYGISSSLHSTPTRNSGWV